MDLPALLDELPNAIKIVAPLAILAVPAVLILLPGKVTAWQRFVFLVTAGRRGAWREAAPRDPIAENALAVLRLRIERETDRARKADWLAAAATVRDLQEKEARYAQELKEAKFRIDQHNRGRKSLYWVGAVVSIVLSLHFLFVVVMGALTQETISFDDRYTRGGVVSLEAEPGFFWFSMVVSLALGVLLAWLAIGCVRALRSYRGIDRHDPEDQGSLIEIGRILGGPRKPSHVVMIAIGLGLCVLGISGFDAWFYPSPTLETGAALLAVGLGFMLACLAWRAPENDVLSAKRISKPFLAASAFIFGSLLAWMGCAIGLPALITARLEPNGTEVVHVSVKDKSVRRRILSCHLKLGLAGYGTIAKGTICVSPEVWDSVKVGDRVKLSVRKDAMGTRIYAIAKAEG